MDHLCDGVPYDLAIRLKSKQGHYKWMNARGSAIWDDDGKPIRICGSIRDVTDRIISEQILRIQYELAKAMINSSDFESFYNVIPVLMNTVGWAAGAIWHLKPGKTGSPQVILSKTFGDTHSLYDRHDDEDTLSTLMQVMNSNELVYEQTSGSSLKRSIFAHSQGFNQVLIFPLQSSDKVVGAVELFHPDVREERKDLRELTHLLGTQIGTLVDRLQVEGELRERDHQLSSIVDSAPDGIITLCDQEIITANSAAHRMFGFDDESLIHRPVSEIMPDLPKLLREIAANRDRKNKGFEVTQLTGLKQDRSVVPVEASISSFKMHGAEMLTVILRDITERKQMEQRVSDFYSMVSHELRTPITSIKGSLSLMADGFAGDLSELSTELVQIARDESDRLLRLINDILDIRKIGEGKLTLRISVNDLDELVGTSIDALRGFADHENITLIKEVANTRRIDCDRDRIIQVLANLVSNAVKFSASGSKVTVHARHTNNLVHVSVTDTGNGIPESELKRLFTPFQQLDGSSTRSKGGTGLGLAISKAIVHEHGGKIGVESKVGAGTTFWFEIPCSQSRDDDE
jgi:PAS domain S-box-containing protein